MVFFKLRSLPATSYGYQPPPRATARGWKCTDFDCGVSEHEPVRRWPKECPQCGAATDPLCDPPWEHEAEGVELQWLIRNHPERGGGFYQDQWQIWQFKDALLRGDRTAAGEARASARAHAVERMQNDAWWGPGRIFFTLVWHELEVDLDWAADDLVFWLGVSSTEDVENNNTNRTNSREVIDIASRFLAAGGRSHARTPEIRAACLKIAEDAFQILNREQQDTVAQLARA